MATARRQVGYGLSDALPSLAPNPIVAKRAPTTADIGYQLGQLWVQPKTAAGVVVDGAWILTSIIGNSANWADISGGSASFTSLVVGPGGAVINGGLVVDTLTTTGFIDLASVGASANTIGNTSGATSLAISVGTGGFSVNGVGASTYAIGAATTTGTIAIGGTAQSGTMTIGSSSAANTFIIAGGAGATTLQIANVQTAGSVSIGTGMTTGTISMGGSAQTGTVSIATGTGAQTINIGTGATGVKTINMGTGAVADVITIGSSTAGNITTLASSITSLPGPVYIYTGAGAPGNGLALHIGDLYINTTAATDSTRMYIATGIGAWTNVTTGV